MEYNSNITHKFKQLKGCNEQWWIWDAIDQNEEFNHTLKNESDNFMGGSFLFNLERLNQVRLLYPMNMSFHGTCCKLWK
jgi:hypothetical protein